jgi:hypothetical protein
MTTINIKDRNVRGSAKKALIDMHTDPKWAIFEALLNSFTAMRKMDKKEVYITQNAGNNHDVIIEDLGEGISNDVYEYLENNMGYEINEEYLISQKDPEYLNKMGIGMNGIADMSIDGILEFNSVSIDKQARENGLIARYMIDRKTGGSGFVVPAEHPSHTYVLQRKLDEVQTGVRLVIKNAKEVRKLSEFIAEKFERKITQGYKIFIRNKEYEVFEQIHTPKDFCGKHEEIIGCIEDYPVNADLHSVDKKDDIKVGVLVKKIRVGTYLSKHMMKGYAGCDILELVVNREGIKADESNEIYQAFTKIVDEYAKQQKFELTPDSKDTDKVKNKKKWTDMIIDKLLNFYKLHPDKPQLNFLALKKKSNLTFDSKVGGSQKPKPNTKTDVRIKKPSIPTGRINKKHKHRNRTNRITDSDQEGEPDLELIPINATKQRPLIYLDVMESAIMVNKDWPNAYEKIENATDDFRDAMISWTIAEAFSETREEFHMIYSEALDG